VFCLSAVTTANSVSALHKYSIANPKFQGAKNKTLVQAGFELQLSNEAGLFSQHPDLL
jgi:16S rRNA G1207 methylase RsmC